MIDDQSAPWVGRLLAGWTAVALAFGVLLAIRGAWLVLLFIVPVCLGLRVALKARPSCASRETLSIGPVEVLHRTIHRSGDATVSIFSRYGCRLEISNTGRAAERLVLRAGTDRVEIGVCLISAERRELARELASFFKR